MWCYLHKTNKSFKKCGERGCGEFKVTSARVGLKINKNKTVLLANKGENFNFTLRGRKFRK